MNVESHVLITISCKKLNTSIEYFKKLVQKMIMLYLSNKNLQIKRLILANMHI